MTELRYTYGQVQAMKDAHAAELAALKEMHAEAISRTVLLTAILAAVETKRRLSARQQESRVDIT